MCILEFRKSVVTISSPESWLGAVSSSRALGPEQGRVGSGGREAQLQPCMLGQATHPVLGSPDANPAHTRHSRCSMNAWRLVADACLMGRKPELSGSWRVGGSQDRRDHTAPC